MPHKHGTEEIVIVTHPHPSKLKEDLLVVALGPVVFLALNFVLLHFFV